MSEDTRKLILRIQSEDLADLWTASANDKSEIDATQRVYRRQLSLLDRHLENTRQTRTIEGAGEAAGHDAVTLAPQITDIDAPILTEDGDVLRVGVPYRSLKTSFLRVPAFCIPRSVVATTARSFPQVSDRPVVRLPPFAPTTGEQVDKLMRDEREAAIRGKQGEMTSREAEREEVIEKTINTSRIPVDKHQQPQPVPSRAQPVDDMSISDVPTAQHRRKVERMMTVVPGRAINVLYKALQSCHGNVDLAIDMIIHQEEHNRNMGIVGLTVLDLENNAAQLKLAAKQQTKARKRAIAESYTTNLKHSISAAGVRRPILMSTEPSAIATTNLKRSADHFTTPNVPPSKKQASIVIKTDPDTMPGSPAQKDTIRDKLETLLQLSRSLPNPRVMPPGPPPPPPGLAQRYGIIQQHSMGPIPAMPGMSPGIVRRDFSNHSQRPPPPNGRPSPPIPPLHSSSSPPLPPPQAFGPRPFHYPRHGWRR
jgi:hypothetical protein